MTTPIPEPSLFRKKPVVVSAVQYPCTHPALRRCSCDANSACSSCGREFIMTLEGPLNVSPGDWIITGVQGEHYPCKPDIFAATYEPASGQPEPITVALDPDPRGVSVGVWQGSHCIYNEAHAVPVAPGDAQDEDDSIALDKLADYIADTWPDKKYGLEEICQRLHAMWPGEFLSAADLEKNDPNVREALRALLLWWNRFQASDGDPKDACELLVKGARSAWQFAEVEIDRVPVPAPAGGDAREVDPLQGAANWLVQAHSQPCPTVLSACLMIGYNRASRLYDAALAAQVPQQGEA